MIYTLESIKKDITELDARTFFHQYIIRSENWYFEKILEIPPEDITRVTDDFKTIVSDVLGVSFNNILITGSGKTGYSLSPNEKKLFKKFSEDGEDRMISDIDVAIVSDKLFQIYWDLFRKSYNWRYKTLYDYIPQAIYRGYIDERPLTSKFDRNGKSIKEISDSFFAGKLVIDSSYQRRKVWMEKDNVNLIATILLDFIIPEVFFWQASIDSDTGDALTHIVDGQQRVAAIVGFIKDEFKLSAKHLDDDDCSEINERCENKLFSELAAADKKQIWNYKLSIVEINPEFKKTDIKYCCSVYILANEGVIDETNDEKINAYTDDFMENFDVDGRLTKKIQTAMEIIEKLNDSETAIFVSKKAQMYTLFSFAFRLIDTGIANCLDKTIENLNQEF
jgi:hypothetical protein